jgi:hypothetical protein
VTLALIVIVALCPIRPTFDKIASTLSDYYKTLKQYQDPDADGFGADSDDEPEGKASSTIATTSSLARCRPASG